MRLFVTGGAGFIGANYVRWVLAHSSDDVVVFDKLTYAGNMENLRDLSGPRFEFVRGDICDADAVRDAMAGCDAVLNFAAESHVDRSILYAGEFVRTNVMGTNTLLDIARSLGVERFVHVSTDEVYGSIPEGSFREGDPLTPSSPYSASKAGADVLAHAYWVTFDFPVIVTRSSNNFGPYQFPEKLIPLFVTRLMDGERVPLYGDGLNVRDWIYVLDNCSGIDVALRRGRPGQTYNVGGGNEMTNIDLTHRVLALLGKDASFIEYVPDRPGHDRRYSIDTSKIRALGWKPELDFDRALEATVEWYRANRWWWEPLKQRGAAPASDLVSPE